jgi:mannose-6-phosphate isomerase-like protein (cupin superfamily)
MAIIPTLVALARLRCNEPMRYALLLSFVLAAPAVAAPQTAPAPTPPRTGAPTQTPPRTGAPAPAQPARPRATAPAQPARSGMAITVSDSGGVTIENVHVEVTGPMSRTGDTNMAGQVNFPGLPVGTYRLRFSGEGVVAFEREATLRGGQVTPVQVTLTRAEAPKAVAPPAAPPAKPAAAGPVGSPQWGSLTDLAKKAQQSKPPRREVMVACSGNSRSTLLIMTDDQPQRVYDDAEATYYVLDGQGTVTIGDRPGEVSPGSFVSVPRGMPYSVKRRTNKPLVMLWVLSGALCEEAR